MEIATTLEIEMILSRKAALTYTHF